MKKEKEIKNLIKELENRLILYPKEIEFILLTTTKTERIVLEKKLLNVSQALFFCNVLSGNAYQENMIKWIKKLFLMTFKKYRYLKGEGTKKLEIFKNKIEKEKPILKDDWIIITELLSTQEVGKAYKRYKLSSSMYRIHKKTEINKKYQRSKRSKNIFLKIVEIAENKLKKINASYQYLFRIIPDNIYLSVPYCNSKSTWIMEEELKKYKVINEIEKLLEKDYYVKRSLSIEDIIKNEIKNLNLEKKSSEEKEETRKEWIDTIWKLYDILASRIRAREIKTWTKEVWIVHFDNRKKLEEADYKIIRKEIRLAERIRKKIIHIKITRNKKGLYEYKQFKYN